MATGAFTPSVHDILVCLPGPTLVLHSPTPTQTKQRQRLLKVPAATPRPSIKQQGTGRVKLLLVTVAHLSNAVLALAPLSLPRSSLARKYL